MAAVGALALLVSGCASSSSSSEPTTPLTSATTTPANPDASLAAAAATARLDPCPRTDPAPTGAPGVSTSADRLPDLTLDCLGEGAPATVRLGALRGPAVVNVWGSWCGPCREEAPLLQRLHATAGSALQVLGIDYEDADVPALAFAAEQGLRYPSVTDPDGDFPLRRWAVGPPVTLFVDAAGAITHVQRGPFATWSELAGLVEAHLGLAL